MDTSTMVGVEPLAGRRPRRRKLSSMSEIGVEFNLSTSLNQHRLDTATYTVSTSTRGFEEKEKHNGARNS